MKQLWRRIWIAALIGIAVLSTSINSMASDDHSKRSVSQLIDDLTQIDSTAPGLDGGALYDGFLGNESSIAFQMGVLGVPPPKVHPQMLELVRRGAVALPELIKHLDDRRPTKLEVGNKDAGSSTHQVGVDMFWWTVFSDEYDPRSNDWRFDSTKNVPTQGLNEMHKDFTGRYTVKVGDVCYVLIGQIVSRHLVAVRYQASAGLVVNSPIEAPVLVEQVRNDWSGVDAEALKESLLSDIHPVNPKLMSDQSYTYYTYHYINPALERLRLYFPDTYNALEGDDLKAKNKFEEDEAKRQSVLQR